MEEMDLYAEFLAFFSQHQILTIIWVVLLAYLIWLQFIILKNGIKYVESLKASSLINHENYAIIDVRSRDDFKKGHIVNAIQLSLEDVKAKNLSLVEKFKDTGAIIVGKEYDDQVAYNAAVELKKIGYRNTFVLNGGMMDWNSRGFPVSKS